MVNPTTNLCRLWKIQSKLCPLSHPISPYLRGYGQRSLLPIWLYSRRQILKLPEGNRTLFLFGIPWESLRFLNKYERKNVWNVFFFHKTFFRHSEVMQYITYMECVLSFMKKTLSPGKCHAHVSCCVSNYSAVLHMLFFKQNSSVPSSSRGKVFQPTGLCSLCTDWNFLTHPTITVTAHCTYLFCFSSS